MPVTLQSHQQINQFNDIINGTDGGETSVTESRSKKYKKEDTIKPSKKLIKSVEKANASKNSSQLPFFEKSTTDFDTYFANTVSYNADEQGKSGAKKIEPGEIEYFHVFSHQNIGFELDYYEVSRSLMSILILVYNKMYDNRCLNEHMYGYFEIIDKAIMETFIDPLTADIEEIAQVILEDQFSDIMNKLNFEDIIKNHLIEPEFNKLTQKQ